LPIFHVGCIRWCRFTFLPCVSKKNECCQRGNYKSLMMV